MIVALPAFVDPAVPVDVPLAVNAAASEVLQVRFCVIWVLDESVTVAVMFRDPFAKMKEVKLVFSTANDMDNTGQVINCTGGLVTPEVVVKIVVIPGVTAVARAWPGRSPLVVLLTVWWRHVRRRLRDQRSAGRPVATPAQAWQRAPVRGPEPG